ncbi:hypothetical protein D0Z07_8120 [Hyphodiscus hymeniophilus]|uniref:Fungal N-terminal domain-containing protein n=1 Tax=Hyphodiscus hymeniophilus TaxID=353542 RepID=A0A9P6VE94_9HELO|nr:hypothetical protein D0Z07_8120 [Hyphodiscus hymeniophilus]
MAEIVGVVASGIAVAQLAGQLTSSIVKLKGFWDHISEIPDEIRQLSRQIELLNFILCRVKDDVYSPESSKDTYFEQSFGLCQEAADELSSLVSELTEKINGKTRWRKKAGAVRCHAAATARPYFGEIVEHDEHVGFQSFYACAYGPETGGDYE